jgi:hypothetical protein
MNKLVYIIGGVCLTTDFVAHTYVFDATTNTTDQLSDMNKARGGISAAAIPKDNAIIVCGGGSSAQSLFDNTCEQLDVANNVWTYIQPLPIKNLDFHSSLTLLGRPFIFGGQYDFFVTTHETYTLGVDGNWKRLANIPARVTDASAINLDDGTAIICGGGTITSQGVTPSAKCYIYSASNDKWTTSPHSLAQAQSQHVIVRSIGRLWCLGGINVNGTSMAVEVYDPTTGWQALPVDANHQIARNTNQDQMVIAAVSG